VVSNFTNVSRDFPFGPDDPCIWYVGNSFLITWWQCYLTQLGVTETSVIPPIVSIRVRLGGRSAPFADRHYIDCLSIFMDVLLVQIA